MTRIKICGLRNPEHAIIAAEAGADFVGMVFAESRRRVSIEQGRAIITALRRLPYTSEIVGVFANSPAKVVNRIVHVLRLDRVQLSGDESLEYCRDIEFPIIKVIHVSNESTSSEILKTIAEGGRLVGNNKITFMLDTRANGAYGGTGQSFDRTIAKEVATRFPVLIAGGLTPESVGELIRDVNPFGVDVSSGVETNYQKDPMKIKAFIKAVREAGCSW